MPGAVAYKGFKAPAGGQSAHDGVVRAALQRPQLLWAAHGRGPRARCADVCLADNLLRQHLSIMQCCSALPRVRAPHASGVGCRNVLTNRVDPPTRVPTQNNSCSTRITPYSVLLNFLKALNHTTQNSCKTSWSNQNPSLWTWFNSTSALAWLLLQRQDAPPQRPQGSRQAKYCHNYGRSRNNHPTRTSKLVTMQACPGSWPRHAASLLKVL